MLGMGAETGNGVWTVGRLLQWTKDWLGRRGVDEPRLSAELLLAHALRCAKIEVYTRFDDVPEEACLTKYRELVRRAGEHEPIAYLLGKKEFFSLDFEVSPAVLVPRPETETLVHAVVDYCRADPREEWSILDAGTGSGCIAVAVAKYVGEASVVATDQAVDAVAVCRKNVERHGLANRVRVVQADWIDVPPELRPRDGYDVIVSNPPYIIQATLTSLPPTVRDYEPLAALDGGPDGLAAYRRLAETAPAALAPGGAVFVELGHGQCDAVVEIFAGRGRLVHCRTWQDQGRIDRVLQFQSEAAG